MEKITSFTIDHDKCCKEFNSKVENYIVSNPKAIISRRIVGELFDLKDKSLRNLPRLQQMISDYKQIHNQSKST